MTVCLPSIKLTCGAFFVTLHSTIEIGNSTFSGNNAGIIGVVLRVEDSCSLVVTKSNFTCNHAIRYGGVASIQRYSHLLATDNSFSHNSVDTNGGGVFDVNVQSVARVYRCIIDNSTANTGGAAIILRESTFLIEDSTLTGSQGNIDLGGIVWAVHRIK